MREEMMRTMCKKNGFITVLAITLLLIVAGFMSTEESNAVSLSDLNLVTITSISSYDGKIHIEWKSNNPSGTRVVAHYGEGNVYWTNYVYPDSYGVDHNKGSMDIKSRNLVVGRTYQVYLETYYDGVGAVAPSSGYKTITVKGYYSLSKNVWKYGTSVDHDAVYYEFKTSGRSDSTYRFDCRGINDDSVNMELLNYGASPRDEDAWKIVAYGTKNSSDCTSYTRKLQPNRTYRLRVYFTYGHTVNTAFGGIPYRIKVTEVIKKPARGKVTSWKAGKKKATVKYSKLAKATRYQIAYKIKGGKYKYINTKYRSRTIKGLKSKKYYYVKVRGQRYVNGNYYSGPWSAVKRVKVR